MGHKVLKRPQEGKSHISYLTFAIEAPRDFQDLNGMEAWCNGLSSQEWESEAGSPQELGVWGQPGIYGKSSVGSGRG